MKGKVFTILFFCLLFLHSAQQKEKLNFCTPAFVVSGQPFEIEISGKFSEMKFNNLRFTLDSEFDFEIDSVFLRIKNKKMNLDKNYFSFVKSNKIELFFNKNDIGLFNSKFQIIFVIKNRQKGICEFDLTVTKYLDNVPVKIFSSDDNLFCDQNIQPQNIKFYVPEATSENALFFNQNSKFNFSIPANRNGIIADFWVKFNKYTDSFVTFLGNDTDTLFNVSVNRYGLLALITNRNFEFLNECFVSKNTWTRISIFSKSNQSSFKNHFEIYANGKLIFTVENSNQSKVSAEFISTQNGFSIDDFCMYELKKQILFEADENKHFKNIFHSSEKICELNFNKYQTGIEISNLIEIRNAEYTKSDAPFVSEVPILNVDIHENYYSLSWKAIDITNVEKYILEKVINKNSPIEVYETNTFGCSEGETFTFTDVRGFSRGAVYYRLKQINKDKSISYSSEVKIGQRKSVNFEIEQNYPNPFNPTTNLKIRVKSADDFEVNIFNVVGIKIKEIFKGYLSEGEHNFQFDGTEYPSGIYFFEIRSNSASIVRKMILAK